MKRNAPSIASFFDFKSKTAYPPTTSLASVKGPSIAVTRPPESRTRVLAAVGASPPLAIIVPALTASSLSFAMASMSSLGGGPEYFSACLTSIINRIVTPLLCVFVFRFGAGFPVRLRTGLQSWLYCNVEHGPAKSTCLAISFRPVRGEACRGYGFLAAAWARSCSSCFLSSGVSSEPKSSASNTWRISISASPSWGLGQRLTHSIASSIDLTCHSQKPAISSLVSVKGPSITVRFPPEKRTRLPFELAWSPSAASSTPAFTSSSLYFPISARSFCFGKTPASESLLALTITMNRIVMSPFEFELRAGGLSGRPRPGEPDLYSDVERRAVRSTGTVSFLEVFVKGSRTIAPQGQVSRPCLGSYDAKHRPDGCHNL